MVTEPDCDTTNIRIVLDASSKAPSLSVLLSPGTLAPDVLDLLLQFRRYLEGLAVDTEKAFLQISLDESDCSCLHFLGYLATSMAREPLSPIETWQMTHALQCKIEPISSGHDYTLPPEACVGVVPDNDCSSLNPLLRHRLGRWPRNSHEAFVIPRTSPRP